jgi:hypothetical protein
VTDNTGRYTEHRGRYPSRRGTGLELHANATDDSRRDIWRGWKDSNLRMAGSKRHMDQGNQQVAEITDRRVPSSPFDSPSLPPNLPPAIGETAVVLGPARGTTNYLLLSANLRGPAAPCLVTPFRSQAHQRIARNDPKESRKVALRLISRGRLTVRRWESSLAARKVLHPRVASHVSDPGAQGI